MFRKLSRRSRYTFDAMCRKKVFDDLEYRENIHPVLKKLRSGMEKFIDYLEKDERTEFNNTPVVYQGRIDEMKTLLGYKTEIEKEHKYIVERWNQLIQEVESSRLQYFDNLYGTNTYFQPCKPHQERILIDVIFENTRVDKSDLYDAVQRANKNILATTMDNDYKDMMRPSTPQKFPFEDFDRQMLMFFPTFSYDALGRPYSDPYKYTDPKQLSHLDQSMIIPFIENEQERFSTRINHYNPYFQRVSDQIYESLSKMSMYEMIPLFTANHAFLYCESLRSIIKIPKEEYISCKKTNFSGDNFEVVGANKDLLAVLQESEKGVDDPRKLLKTWMEANPNQKPADVSFEIVNTLEEIREYFFNFKDDMSFGICRHLKNEPINDHDIIRISITPDEKYMLLTMNINGFYLTVLQDLQSGLYFKRYIVSSQDTQPHIVSSEDGKVYLMEATLEQGIFRLRKSIITSQDFIPYNCRSEEISSVIKYMREFSESLYLNNQDHYEDVINLQTHYAVTGVTVFELAGTPYYRVLLENGTTQFMILDDKLQNLSSLNTGGKRGYLGKTKHHMYLVEAHPNDLKLYRQGSNGWEKISIPGVLKDAIFLGDYIVLSIQHPLSQAEELYSLKDVANPSGEITLKKYSLSQTEAPRVLTLLKSSEQMKNQVMIITACPGTPRELWLIDLEDGSKNMLCKEYFGSSASHDLIEEAFVETPQLTSTFVFSSKNAHKDSPLLIWFSDKTNFDLYNPILDDLVNKDFLVLLVRHKKIAQPNMKSLLDEFTLITNKIAAAQLSNKMFLVAEGPVAGFAGLTTHMRNVNIFKAAAIIDPITDLLELHNSNPGVDFGYGDVKKSENIDEFILDSPYFSKDQKLLTKTLLISSNHTEGHGAFKFYARAKHAIKPDGDVYWVKGDNDFIADSITWLGFFWSFLMRDATHKKRERPTSKTN